MLEETSSHRDKLNATGRTKMILKACVTIPSKGVAYLNTLFSEYCVSSITRPRPRPKAFRLGFGRVFSFGFANRRFWDADWSQVGDLETMIGSRARYSDHVFVRLFSWEAIMVLACQVGPFHLTLTQINSEINCIAKNKCPESQKLDARRRSENMIAISPRVTKSNNIVCTHYVKMFCILCLCIILYDTSKAPENLTFVLKQSHSVDSYLVRLALVHMAQRRSSIFMFCLEIYA